MSYKYRVLVGTPSYDGNVQGHYAQNLVAATQHANNHDIAVASMIVKDCPFLDLSRNMIVAKFLDTDFTHLLFIDADTGIPMDAITRLVEADLPITAGLSASRRRPWHFNVRMGPRQRDDGWIEVTRIGMAVFCIRRDVLETLAESASETYTQIVGHKVPILFRAQQLEKMRGEDYYFCDLYREAYEAGTFDEPIWMWPDMTINHDGEESNFAQRLRQMTQQHNGKRFVITGTGRSGSRYIANVFTGLGLQCGHEHAYSLHQDNVKNWHGDSSWIAAASLPLPHTVFHQVRHPLDVINSLCGEPDYMSGSPDSPDYRPWWTFKALHCPELVAGDPAALNAMRWWYHWNKRIEPHAEMRWRVEDLDAKTLVTAAAKLGYDISEQQAADVLNNTAKDVNSHAKKNLAWADLPDIEIKHKIEEMALRYGYDI